MMPPDTNWPALPAYGPFTREMHAAHTSPKGVPYPADLIPGAQSHKMAKLAMKIGFKPHLKMTKTNSRRATTRRRKKEPR